MGCGLILDACAIVDGIIAVLEVMMRGGRVERRILNWLASCAFRPLCGRPRSWQSSIIVAFRAVSKSMVRSLSNGDDISQAVSRKRRGWQRNSVSRASIRLGSTLVSLVPRPHPLTRRNDLVNQVEFLGLGHAFVTM